MSGRMFQRALYRHWLRSSPICGAGLFTFLNENADKVIAPKFDSPEYERALKEDTGWQRVKDMYTLDIDGKLSMELNSVAQISFSAAFVGLVLGGVNKSRFAFNNFVNNNQATAFQSNFEAKKKLQREVSLAFGKGGFQLAWRMALFTTYYCGAVTTISVYRGKSSVWEYIASGAIAGAIYKIPLGLRGSFVGGVVGSVLGTIGGILTISLMRATGMSVEELRYWQYKFKQSREKPMDSKRDETSQADSDPLLQLRSIASAGFSTGLSDNDDTGLQSAKI